MADDIGMAIIERLKANADVKAAVGQRVYPDALKQGCRLPAIVVIVDVDQPTAHMTGMTEVAEALVEVTAFAEDRRTANAVDKLCRDALFTVAGYVSDETKVKTCRAGLRIWEYERPLDGKSRGRELSRRDYETFYLYEAN